MSSEELPIPISSWLKRLERQSIEFKRRATDLSRTVESVEAALKQVGGLEALHRWFISSQDEGGTDQGKRFGLALEWANSMWHLSYAHGRKSGDKILTIGNWSSLRNADVQTKAEAVVLLPNFLRILYVDLRRRSGKLGRALNKFQSSEQADQGKAGA